MGIVRLCDVGSWCGWVIVMQANGRRVGGAGEFWSKVNYDDGAASRFAKIKGPVQVAAYVIALAHQQ